MPSNLLRCDPVTGSDAPVPPRATTEVKLPFSLSHQAGQPWR
jgi:hypothetical protein